MQNIQEDNQSSGLLIPNFRSIHRNGDSPVISHDKSYIYRSAGLGSLTHKQLKYLEQKRINKIIDLRSEKETLEEPDSNLGSISYVNIPLVSDKNSPSKITMIINAYRMADYWREMMAMILDENSESIKTIIIELAKTTDTKSTLLHCTGGKNRTGIISLLLMSELGATREQIISDYMESNMSRQFITTSLKEKLGNLLFLGISVENFYPFYSANREQVVWMLDYINQKYGSPRRYLRQKAGISENVLSKLRDKFTI